MANDLTRSLGDAPNAFASPPTTDMHHSLTLRIPLPTTRAATQLFHVLRVDKELKPKETFVGYRIRAEEPTVLDIKVSCTTVRQLRLATNALMDNIQLVLETMEAFTPAAEQGGDGSRSKATLPDEEFELSGTGRAG